MQQTCSKCKKDFDCRNETRGCWCEGVQLSHVTLAHLKAHYDDCLCPECLIEFESFAGSNNSDEKIR